MIKIIHKALRDAKEKAGTQKKLEGRTGVGQSSIAAFINGSRKIENMTVGTLIRLFPEMQIAFTRKELEEELDLCKNSNDRILRRVMLKLLQMSKEQLKDIDNYINKKI